MELLDDLPLGNYSSGLVRELVTCANCIEKLQKWKVIPRRNRQSPLVLGAFEALLKVREASAFEHFHTMGGNVPCFSIPIISLKFHLLRSLAAPLDHSKRLHHGEPHLWALNRCCILP